MFVCVCICICVCVYCNESDGFCVAEELFVCVERERERKLTIPENQKTVFQRKQD